MRHGFGLQGSCGGVVVVSALEVVVPSVEGIGTVGVARRLVVTLVVAASVIVSAAVVSALVLTVVQGSSVVVPTGLESVVKPVEKLQGSSTSGT